MHALAVTIPAQDEHLLLWIVTLLVHDGQALEAGQVMARLESRAGSLELLAPQAGYVVGLRAQAGQSVEAGTVLCYLADQPTLASAHPATQLSARLANASLDASAILVYGGGGHGKAVIELLRAMRTYRLVGLIDDSLPLGSEVLGVPVVGGAVTLKEWHNRGVRLAVNAVGGIGDVAVRLRVFDTLAQAGFSCPVLVHPAAVVEPSALLEPGVQVLAQAYVGSSARVGFGSLINAGAVVSHDCTLGRVTNLSPGAALAGFVQLGNYSQVGMNATLNLHVTVGEGCLIGNGATVKADVPSGERVWAGSTWPRRS
jgi:acetyltransferase EpsM